MIAFLLQDGQRKPSKRKCNTNAEMNFNLDALHSISRPRSTFVPSGQMSFKQSVLKQSKRLQILTRSSLHTATRETVSPLNTEDVLSRGRAAVLEHWPAANHVVIIRISESRLLCRLSSRLSYPAFKALQIFAKRLTDKGSYCEQIQYRGEGTHLGVKGQWTLAFRPDGAFVEEFKSPMLSSVSGHDGGRDSRCWVVRNT